LKSELVQRVDASQTRSEVEKNSITVSFGSGSDVVLIRGTELTEWENKILKLSAMSNAREWLHYLESETKTLDGLVLIGNLKACLNGSWKTIVCESCKTNFDSTEVTDGKNIVNGKRKRITCGNRYCQFCLLERVKDGAARFMEYFEYENKVLHFIISFAGSSMKEKPEEEKLLRAFYSRMRRRGWKVQGVRWFDMDKKNHRYNAKIGMHWHHALKHVGDLRRFLYSAHDVRKNMEKYYGRSIIIKAAERKINKESDARVCNYVKPESLCTYAGLRTAGFFGHGEYSFLMSDLYDADTYTRDCRYYRGFVSVGGAKRHKPASLEKLENQTCPICKEKALTYATREDLETKYYDYKPPPETLAALKEENVLSRHLEAKFYRDKFLIENHRELASDCETAVAYLKVASSSYHLLERLKSKKRWKRKRHTHVGLVSSAKTDGIDWEAMALSEK